MQRIYMVRQFKLKESPVVKSHMLYEITAEELAAASVFKGFECVWTKLFIYWQCALQVTLLIDLERFQQFLPFQLVYELKMFIDLNRLKHRTKSS